MHLSVNSAILLQKNSQMTHVLGDSGSMVCDRKQAGIVKMSTGTDLIKQTAAHLKPGITYSSIERRERSLSTDFE